MSVARPDHDSFRALARYATALWGGPFDVRLAPAEALRSAFDERELVLPPVRDETSVVEWRLAYARAAHAAAHTVFSGPCFEVGSLKPLQQVLVGLFEDARVEALAIQRFPGLRHVWAPFHETHAPVAPLASLGAVLARLSRSLFDSTYADPDHWIRKACAQFRAVDLASLGPQQVRQLGNLLGNELGQMRLPFDARQYVVEPAYRDDHSGLWQRPPAPAKSVSPERSHDPGDDTPEASDVTTHAYGEWDYVIARTRPAFCRLKESQLRACSASPGSDRGSVPFAAGVRQSLSRVLRSSGRARRDGEGPALDLAAVVDSAAERRAGRTATLKLYRRAPRRTRSRRALVLLDLSESTNSAGSDGRCASELAATCAALLGAAALPALELAIDGFSSYGRSDVRYRRFKDFTEPAAAALERLGALRGAGSTRLGTALRHASSRLKPHSGPQPLLLVVTDAEPADIDVYDARYLVEDARMAVVAARRLGIAVFAYCLSGGDPVVQRRIFGPDRAPLSRLEELPRLIRAAFSSRSARSR